MQTAHTPLLFTKTFLLFRFKDKLFGVFQKKRLSDYIFTTLYILSA